MGLGKLRSRLGSRITRSQVSNYLGITIGTSPRNWPFYKIELELAPLNIFKFFKYISKMSLKKTISLVLYFKQVIAI